VSIAFLPRDDVLEPLAVVGMGPVARALAERLLQHSDGHLHGLRGVAGDGLLVVLGTSETLPWVDGVSYLGRDPSAPRLLVPTMLRLAVAMDVFEGAMLGHESPLRPPLAVVVSPRRVFSVADALPISRDRLRGWMEAHP
jgi:hypothetical protein